MKTQYPLLSARNNPHPFSYSPHPIHQQALSAAFKTDPQSDPCDTTLLLAITIFCLDFDSSLLIGLLCFLPCPVQSVLHKKPKGSLYNTKSSPVLPLLKTLPWLPPHVQSKANTFLIGCHIPCHLLPSPLMFYCPLALWSHCSQICCSSSRPKPLLSQGLCTCSSRCRIILPQISRAHSLTSFSCVFREAFPDHPISDSMHAPTSITFNPFPCFVCSS